MKDATEADLEPVHVESDNVKKEMAKLSYPEIEGDLAPSAILPKACQSLQKQCAKFDALIAQFKGADRLSVLQQRTLALSTYVFMLNMENCKCQIRLQLYYFLHMMPKLKSSVGPCPSLSG